MAENEKPAEIIIENRRDLVMNMKEISRRFNSNPDVAKRMLMNPIYALEDIGVKLNKEMRDHVHNTFTNPPAAQRRREALEAEIKPELQRLTGNSKIPETPEERANLLFGGLKLKPVGPDTEGCKLLDARRLSSYVAQHPIVERLVQYESVRKAGLVFVPRAIYDSYKRGERRQEWITSLTFKV